MTAGSASIHRGSSAEDGACGIEAHVMLGQSSDIANLPTPRDITRVHRVRVFSKTTQTSIYYQ